MTTLEKGGFFEPGCTYQFLTSKSDDPRPVVAEFRCVGLTTHPLHPDGATLAVGYYWVRDRPRGWDLITASRATWSTLPWVKVKQAERTEYCPYDCSYCHDDECPCWNCARNRGEEE